jgi:hypothetical protein
MTVGAGGAASVGDGIEDGGAGAGAGVAGRTAAGGLVAGAFVAAMLLSRVISPGPGRLVFVSVCARRRFADEIKSPRTIRVDRHELPPYKNVKKVIS